MRRWACCRQPCGPKARSWAARPSACRARLPSRLRTRRTLTTGSTATRPPLVSWERWGAACFYGAPRAARCYPPSSARRRPRRSHRRSRRRNPRSHPLLCPWPPEFRRLAPRVATSTIRDACARQSPPTPPLPPSRVLRAPGQAAGVPTTTATATPPTTTMTRTIAAMSVGRSRSSRGHRPAASSSRGSCSGAVRAVRAAPSI
mmetsp:Transcript_79391/g.230508  ORF Transcript_79391/g.230508 Transcript_79391/m.230508 type:complete len:203 (-) Transcript_79391:751-1359(-)